MPKIETQGLSQDYKTATGLYEPIERGDVSKPELLKILQHLSTLSTPVGEDDCPPTVNTILSGDIYSCFFGDSGFIRCTDSQHEEMTADEALKIMCGEMSLEEFDLSKGHEPRKNKTILILFFVIAVIILGVITFVL